MFNNLTATVLFVQDLDTCRAFYQDKLGLKPTFTDDSSAGFRFGEHDFVLLKFSAAAEMVGAEALGTGNGAGYRVLPCIGVENVDEACKALTDKGVSLLKPPKDQAWGRRTAYFADPEGNLWELWHQLPLDES